MGHCRLQVPLVLVCYSLAVQWAKLLTHTPMSMKLLKLGARRNLWALSRSVMCFVHSGAKVANTYGELQVPSVSSESPTFVSL